MLPFIFITNKIHDHWKHDHRHAVIEFTIKKNKSEALDTNLLVLMHSGEEGIREREIIVLKKILL